MDNILNYTSLKTFITKLKTTLVSAFSKKASSILCCTDGVNEITPSEHVFDIGEIECVQNFAQDVDEHTNDDAYPSVASILERTKNIGVTMKCYPIFNEGAEPSGFTYTNDAGEVYGKWQDNKFYLYKLGNYYIDKSVTTSITIQYDYVDVDNNPELKLGARMVIYNNSEISCYHKFYTRSGRTLDKGNYSYRTYFGEYDPSLSPLSSPTKNQMLGWYGEY